MNEKYVALLEAVLSNMIDNKPEKVIKDLETEVTNLTEHLLQIKKILKKLKKDSKIENGKEFKTELINTEEQNGDIH